MNARERMLAALMFGQPDRIPLAPGGGRESTLKRWHAEGLPEGVSYQEYAYRQAGGKLDFPPPSTPKLSFPVKFAMIPEFEQKIIERRANSQVVQDWKGNICEIGLEYSTEYLGGQNSKKFDFVTRRWIKCPVENRADWAEMQRRYDPAAAGRLAADAAANGAQLRDRNWFMQWGLSGPFWQLREWLGFENLCTMFYDDPGLVRDMIAFWEDFVARLLRRALDCVVPDSVHVSEDMAYKGFSMISPAMVREFLLPTWKRWGELIRGAGVPVYAMDSDGFVGELIPFWIEAGVNVCDPIEVAAGNDINAFRKKFGRNMAYRGGVDKRAMARGGRVIAAEIARLQPVIDGGGYVPGCDHGIPPDVSWPNFVEYVGRLARAIGWL